MSWGATGVCVPFLTTEQLTADEAEGTATPSPKHHPQLTHMGKEGGRLGPEGRDVRRGARLIIR